ncbi:ABC transporter ATP-binding protein/permease [Mycobacterium sp.]|uniref:ABC transporter ATP-binding protein/permease n=1 Tax=Mycobacterium sp. TaxID=1785 RepID=UPI002B9C0D0F|nr:ATP-binding cassette domain-containing protein [Mycobacterium sp.]HTH92510.1 ATP-binding cassette domain-containing protein [Mycobacterium sp.]
MTDLQPDPLSPTLQISDTFGGDTGAFPPASPRTVSGDSGDADGDSEHPIMVAATCASAVNDTFEAARRADGVGGGLSRGQRQATGRIGRSVGSVDIGCLLVDAVGLRMDNDRELLRDVSFVARPGSLNAIIGPSGAGKSTLAKLVAGIMTPTSGAVRFDGYDIHGQYTALRTKIGMVPQDDVVHHQLTVAQALGYAAEIRLPRACKEERRQAVDRVLGELDLTDHAHCRVDKLSGGQRKRASVALELLTSPSLLILDEPTSGLDPALDRQIMRTLRRLADAGRVVFVVTHCLSYLDMCDQVLLLAPGGKPAYCGPPSEIACITGTTNWADIFATVSADPDAANRDHLSRSGGALPKAAPASRGATLPPRTPKRVVLRQVSTVARRQVRLVLADRGYSTFLAVLPFILGTLTLLVPGRSGFAAADPHGPAPDEPSQVLMLINISAVFMGTALTIRDLVGERLIFRREQAVGLSPSAYLTAKIVVYSCIGALQTAVLTAIVVIGKGGPTHGAVILGNPVFELYVTLAATAAVAAVTGMMLSAAARSHDQILPMLVIAVMLSIVFSGGLIPVTRRVVLDQLSWLVPARWGFAASASTIDLRRVDPTVRVNDPMWSHDLRSWLLAIGLLSALGMVAAVMVRWRLRLAALCRYIGRVASEPELTGRPPGRGRLLDKHLVRLGTAQHRNSLTRSDRAPVASTSRSRGRHRARGPGRPRARGADVIAAHRTPR